MSASRIERETLRQIGFEAGLAAVGFASAKPMLRVRSTLEKRKEAGLHGGMNFTYRNPQRSTTPEQIIDDAQTLVCGAWGYPGPVEAAPKSRRIKSGFEINDTGVGTQISPEEARELSKKAAKARSGAAANTESGQTGSNTGINLGEETERPSVKVAAYAWHDHYSDLRTALEKVAEALKEAGYQARVVIDSNSLVDRAAAVRAGLGWSGKNTMLLLEDAGSWFVLGAVVTDCIFETDSPQPNGCGPCRLCIDACPTQALVADGVLDARRCLAWLLQKDGDFPLEFRKALGTRIYGCDECQIVCPPSRRNVALERSGDELARLDTLDLLRASDETLEEVCGRWYIARRDWRYLRRNALVALGNSHIGPELRQEVTELLSSFKSDEMLYRHAQWAAEQHGLSLEETTCTC